MSDKHSWSGSDLYAANRQSYKDNAVNGSNFTDATSNYLASLSLAENQYEMDETWWNEHDSPAAIVDQLRQLGYSDAFISQYLSNGTQSHTTPTSGVSGGSSSGAAQDTIGSVNALGNSVANVIEASKADAQAKVAQAQVNNLNSQSNLNDVNAGLRPAETASQIRVNDSSIRRNEYLNELTAQQTGLTIEECKNYSLQNYYYSDLTMAELRQSSALTSQYISQCKLNNERARAVQSEIDVNEAIATNNMTQAHLNVAQEASTLQDVKGKKIANEEAKMDLDYYKSSGLKISWDDEKKITELIDQGKYDEADKYAQGQFKYQMARASGQAEGEISLPSSYYHDGGKDGKFRQSRDPNGWIRGATRAFGFHGLFNVK